MKFLGKAKKFLRDLGTEPPGRAQYFDVACAAGHRIRGERTEGYQALRCPVCGEGVFVLPRSPLPDPVAPEGMARPGRAAGRGRSTRADDGPIELTNPARGAVELDADGADRAEADIVWDDDPRGGASVSTGIAPEDLAAEEIDAARRAQSAAANRRADARGADTDASPAGRPRSDRRTPVDRTGRGRVVRARPARADQPGGGSVTATTPGGREARAPTRGGPRIGLILFLLLLLITATVGWRFWINRRAQYPMIVERGRTEGIPALDDGDFDRANQLLAAARSAVDALGGAIADADEIRQAAAEAAIFVNLCPRNLEELLADAGRSANPAEWATKFDTLYKGHSYVFDTRIESTPADGGAYEIAYMVFPPGEASRFGDGGLSPPDRIARIDLTGFKAMEQAGLERDVRVTFGATLEAIVYDAERKTWVVRLEPNSGVFITHLRALRAMGWTEPESVELPREAQP